MRKSGILVHGVLFALAVTALGGHGPISTRRKVLPDPYDPSRKILAETIVSGNYECSLRLVPKSPGPDDYVSIELTFADRQSRAPCTDPVRVSIDATRAWRNEEWWRPQRLVADAAGRYHFGHVFLADGLYQINVAATEPGSRDRFSFAYPIRVGTAETSIAWYVLGGFGGGVAALIMAVAVARRRRVSK
ncbi:MAG: hypothetical protein HYY93_01665 [Planctomycetes bacterium]|nr:hypothetical protein [Planctomycetota bacterium]